MSPAYTAVPIVKFGAAAPRTESDLLAVEEPLEIRIAWGHPLSQKDPRREKSISLTMRTPGDDLALAVGFLVSEGIVRARGDVAASKHCGPPVREDGTSNVVKIELAEGTAFDAARLERHFYTTSSCGVCGKTSLEAVKSAEPPRLEREAPRIRPDVVHALPAALRAAQDTFTRTGGLHAAGLFAPDGKLLSIAEDVGRHNAVDKVIGRELTEGHLPLGDRILVVSGRASFELVQKASMAGIPVLAAVGAPSSLAVELAREASMTLLGFVRDGRFNVYADADRVAGETS
jgi:FdhD protein